MLSISEIKKKEEKKNTEMQITQKVTMEIFFFISISGFHMFLHNDRANIT